MFNNKLFFDIIIHGYKNIFQREPYIQSRKVSPKPWQQKVTGIAKIVGGQSRGECFRIGKIENRMKNIN